MSGDGRGQDERFLIKYRGMDKRERDKESERDLHLLYNK